MADRQIDRSILLTWHLQLCKGTDCNSIHSTENNTFVNAGALWCEPAFARGGC